MRSLFQPKYYITLCSLNDQTEFELLSDILIRLYLILSKLLQFFKSFVAAAA